ncbi:MAG: hypothetical protein ACLQVK_21730 [Acidimicrobiales bacterium]
MGAEFLVAILWGVVVVYWLWSRRPAFGDSIGLFRNELYALEHAGPTRVPPANRRRPLPYTVSGATYSLAEPLVEPGPLAAGPLPGGAGTLPAALAAATLSANRLKARRRRRDVLSVLLAAVVVSAIASVLSRSVVALSLQVLSDLALVAYAYLLVTMTKTRLARSSEPRVLPEAKVPSQPKVPVGARAENGAAWPAPPEEDWLVEPVDQVDLDRAADAYTPAHALGAAPGPVPGRRRPPEARRGRDHLEYPSEAYGDFDSYASLALAQAN